ncbi:uncharacterized protein LOC114250663 [Bombyx mandarina]|uniref:Uncharacterized protein LOC114250663 n=1 Tax=Bombyx mandarina TaxID=7092 RepID=A0A6J2KDN3_BOMMA|nr:uncharacterized protein LOC114250663 [Bombyx mandarina]
MLGPCSSVLVLLSAVLAKNTNGELANDASLKINSDVADKSDSIFFVVPKEPGFDSHLVINDIINANRHGLSHEVDHPQNVPNYFTDDNVKHNTESANDDAAYILYHLLRNTNNNDHSDFKEAKDRHRSALRAQCQKVEHCVQKCHLSCKESYDEFNICSS